MYSERLWLSNTKLRLQVMPTEHAYNPLVRTDGFQCFDGGKFVILACLRMCIQNFLAPYAGSGCKTTHAQVINVAIPAFIANRD